MNIWNYSVSDSESPECTQKKYAPIATTNMLVIMAAMTRTMLVFGVNGLSPHLLYLTYLV